MEPRFLKHTALIGILVFVVGVFESAHSLTCFDADKLPQWTKTANKTLQVIGSDMIVDMIVNVRHQQACALACQRHQEFECLSYSYSLSRRECQLAAANIESGTLQLADDPDFDFYSGECVLYSLARQACGNVDLAVVIDGSGSICGDMQGIKTCDNWERVKQFLIRLVNQLDIGRDRMAVVVYSGVAKLEWSLGSYTNDTRSMKAAIYSLAYPGGDTNTYQGLNVMRTQVFGTSEDRPEVRNVAVVITDGKPTKEIEKTAPEAKQATNEGIDVYAVGVTNSVNEETLKALSSYPSQENRNYFKTPNFEALDDTFEQILRAACIPIDDVTASNWLILPPVIWVLLGLLVVIILLFTIIIVTLCNYSRKRQDGGYADMPDRNPLKY